MATTGLWPVKGRINDLINYADNPEKTQDTALKSAIEYAGNKDKTDKRMYVSGINCTVKNAARQMNETKRRFGKTGGNVAYHAYQSFKENEVTAELAHKIGVETAKRMWGSDYEIIVATHLNTDNIHNHIILNSVSMRTGRKFENHRSDHYKLREISDEICKLHELSVLPPKKFEGSGKKEYWVKKSGGLTHRDMIKRDMEKIIPMCGSFRDFAVRLREMGYYIPENQNRKYITVQMKDWERPVRLNSLGYSEEELSRRFEENRAGPEFYLIQYRKTVTYKTYPLYSMLREIEYDIFHTKDTAAILVDVFFYILINLIILIKDENEVKNGNIPRNPAIRMYIPEEKHLIEEYLMLRNEELHSPDDIMNYIDKTGDEINRLEEERKKIRNSNRRPATKEERAEKNRQAREITKKLIPLRKNMKISKRALDRFPQVWNLVKTERDMEYQGRIRERSYER